MVFVRQFIEPFPMVVPMLSAGIEADRFAGIIVKQNYVLFSSFGLSFFILFLSLHLFRGGSQTIVGADFDKGTHGDGGDTANHHPVEEMFVPDELLQPTGRHARQHHAQGHEGRTDGIVGGLMLSVGEIDEVEHVGGESEPVSELFDEDAEVDNQEVVGLVVAEVDERGTGERNAPSHGPKPLFQAAFGGYDTADDTADGEPQNTDGTVDQAYLTRGKSQTAQLFGVEQKGGDEFHQLSLGQTVEEHKEYGYRYLFLPEKGGEGGEKLFEDV